MKKTKVTPGPYRIRDSLPNGCAVLGIHDITVAWVSTAIVSGRGGSHYVDAEECRANAELIRRAFDEQEKKGST